MSLSASQHLIERQLLLASAKKNKKQNRLFCRPELEFRSEIFATVAAQFETITSHSPIYLHCVDAQTLHPTCFYPAAVSLEQHLIPHNVWNYTAFHLDSIRGSPVESPPCYQRALRMLLASISLKKKGGKSFLWVDNCVRWLIFFSPFLHRCIVICFLSPILHPSPAEHIVIINNHHYFLCIVR